MPFDGDSDPVVCRVTPQGDVICDPVVVLGDVPADAAVRKSLSAQIAEAFPEGTWGPNKIRLALNILQVLGDSTLPDSPNIARRSDEIINTISLLLDEFPPSILLYTYSEQPADVVGAYYLNRAELVKMQRLYDTFKSPKKP